MQVKEAPILTRYVFILELINPIKSLMMNFFSDSWLTISSAFFKYLYLASIASKFFSSDAIFAFVSSSKLTYGFTLFCNCCSYELKALKLFSSCNCICFASSDLEFSSFSFFWAFCSLSSITFIFSCNTLKALFS